MATASPLDRIKAVRIGRLRSEWEAEYEALQELEAEAGGMDEITEVERSALRMAVYLYSLIEPDEPTEADKALAADPETRKHMVGEQG